MTQIISTKHPRIGVPHVLVLMLLFILGVCALTYVLPAGEYAIDPKTNLVIPNSYAPVPQSPVSPWDAMIMVTQGVASQGVIFALLFIMGGLINVVIDSGSINALIYTDSCTRNRGVNVRNRRLSRARFPCRLCCCRDGSCEKT